MSEEEPVKYYSLIVSGLGYPSRFRYVNSPEGYLRPHVDINALEGRKSNVHYRRFQTRVATSEAEQILQRFEEKINSKTDKVLVGFRIGDANPASYETGEGERRHFCYGRLLKVEWVRVNGEEAYKAPAAAEVAEQFQPVSYDEMPF